MNSFVFEHIYPITEDIFRAINAISSLSTIPTIYQHLSYSQEQYFYLYLQKLHLRNTAGISTFHKYQSWTGALSKSRNARIRVTYEKLDEMFCFDLGPLQIPHNLGDLLQSNMGTVDPRVEQSQYPLPRPDLRAHSIYSNARGVKFFCCGRLFCKQITVQIKVLGQILLSRARWIMQTEALMVLPGYKGAEEVPLPGSCRVRRCGSLHHSSFAISIYNFNLAVLIYRAEFVRVLAGRGTRVYF